MAARDTDDAKAAIDRIERRGERIRRRELETAIDRLEAHGDLTPGQRAAVEELSTGLVDELLAVPRDAIQRADGEESLAVALRLFAPDQP